MNKYKSIFIILSYCMIVRGQSPDSMAITGINAERFPLIYTDFKSSSSVTLNELNIYEDQQWISPIDTYMKLNNQSQGNVNNQLDIVFLLQNTTGDMQNTLVQVDSAINELFSYLNPTGIDYAISTSFFSGNNLAPEIYRNGELVGKNIAESYFSAILATGPVGTAGNDGCYIFQGINDNLIKTNFRKGSHRLLIIVAIDQARTFGGDISEQEISGFCLDKTTTVSAIYDTTDSRTRNVISNTKGIGYSHTISTYGPVLINIIQHTISSFRLRYISGDTLRSDSVSLILNTNGASDTSYYRSDKFLKLQRSDSTKQYDHEIHNIPGITPIQVTVESDTAIDSVKIFYRSIETDGGWSDEHLVDPDTDHDWSKSLNFSSYNNAVEYYIRAYNPYQTVSLPNAAGNHRRYPYQIVFAPNQVPNITHTVFDSIGVLAFNDSITLDADIGYDASLDSVILYYRDYGDIIFTSYAMTLDDSLYTATIPPPDYDSTSHGEYFIRAFASGGFTGLHGSFDYPHELRTKQNYPPEISHESITSWLEEDTIDVVANITDEIDSLQQVVLQYTQLNPSDISLVTMQLDSGTISDGRWSGPIPFQFDFIDTVRYSIKATDNWGALSVTEWDTVPIFINQPPQLYHSPVDTITDSTNTMVDIRVQDSTHYVEGVWFYQGKKEANGNVVYDSTYTTSPPDSGDSLDGDWTFAFADSLVRTNWTLSYFFKAIDDLGLIALSDTFETTFFFNEPPIINDSTPDSIHSRRVPINISAEIIDSTDFVLQDSVRLRFQTHSNPEWVEISVDSTPADSVQGVYTWTIDTTHFAYIDTVWYKIFARDNTELYTDFGPDSIVVFINQPPLLFHTANPLITDTVNVMVNVNVQDSTHYVDGVWFYQGKKEANGNVVYDSMYTTSPPDSGDSLDGEWRFYFADSLVNTNWTLSYFFKAIDDSGLIALSDTFETTFFFNAPPEIVNRSPDNHGLRIPIALSAEIIDSTHYVVPDSVRLLFRHGDSGLYTDSSFNLIEGDSVHGTYTAMIDTNDFGRIDTLEYKIRATDNTGLSDTIGPYTLYVYANAPPQINHTSRDTIRSEVDTTVSVNVSDTTHWVDKVRFFQGRKFSDSGNVNYLEQHKENPDSGTNQNGEWRFNFADSLIHTNWTISYYFSASDDSGYTTVSDTFASTFFFNKPPIIHHTPVTEHIERKAIELSAEVIDSTHYVLQDSVWLKIKKPDTPWTLILPDSIAGSATSATYHWRIDTTHFNYLDTVFYRIQAMDNTGLTTNYGPDTIVIYIDSPPVITQITPVDYHFLFTELEIYCSILDSTDFVTQADLYLQPESSPAEYLEFNMDVISGSTFIGQLPDSLFNAVQSYRFFITAADNHGNSVISDTTTFYTDYLLGDFDRDNDVDFTDYTAFVDDWNQMPDDLAGDIASTDSDSTVSNLPPWLQHRPPSYPDDIVDFEDQMVFAIMYTWFRDDYGRSLYNSARTGTVSINDEKEQTIPRIIISDSMTVTTQSTVSFSFLRPPNPMGWQVSLHYNADVLQYQGYNDNTEDDDYHRYFTFTVDTAGFFSVSKIRYDSQATFSDTIRLDLHFIPKKRGQGIFKNIAIRARDYRNQEYIDPQGYSKTHTVRVSESLPKKFALHRPYPNPFNPVLIIPIDIPRSSLATIRIYNLLGREVTVLADRSFNAGKYALKWNAARFASGIYFVKMETEEYEKVQKVLLLK